MDEEPGLWPDGHTVSLFMFKQSYALCSTFYWQSIQACLSKGCGSQGMHAWLLLCDWLQPLSAHTPWDQLAMTLSVQRPLIQPHDAAARHLIQTGLAWCLISAMVQITDIYFFLLIFFSFFVSSCFLKELRSPVVHSSVTLVGSQCTGLECTPTSALLCSRAGILAPPDCPLDNWHRPSCYWPLFLVKRWLLWSLSLWKRWWCSLALSVLNLGSVMWFVILFLTGCHANSISKAVVPV